MEILWTTPDKPNSCWWSYGHYFTGTFRWQVTYEYVQSLQFANITSHFVENVLLFCRRWICSTFIWQWLWNSPSEWDMSISVFTREHTCQLDKVLYLSENVSQCLYTLFVNDREWIKISCNCEVRLQTHNVPYNLKRN